MTLVMGFEKKTKTLTVLTVLKRKSKKNVIFIDKKGK